MGAFFSSPGKAEEKDKLCEQCKTAWPDKKKEPDKFKREYSRFRDETGERDPKTRRASVIPRRGATARLRARRAC
jgi:hypothetical protein